VDYIPTLGKNKGEVVELSVKISATLVLRVKRWGEGRESFLEK